GVLICVQLFLGEEVLFLAALTLGVFCVAYTAFAPRRAWRALPTLATGLAVAVGIAVVALGHALWVQFAGPQHVPNGPFSPAYFYADLASFTALSPLRSEEHTSELQSRGHLVCRLLLEKKKKNREMKTNTGIVNTC